MAWRRHPDEPLEPQQGPRLSREHIDRLVAEHRLEIEAEQDRIYAGIRERLGPEHPRIMPQRV